MCVSSTTRFLCFSAHKYISKKNCKLKEAVLKINSRNTKMSIKWIQPCVKEWGFRAPFPHRPSRTRRRTHHYLPLSKPFFDFPRMCIQQSTEAASQSAYFSSAVGVFHEGGCRVAATRDPLGAGALALRVTCWSRGPAAPLRSSGRRWPRRVSRDLRLRGLQLRAGTVPFKRENGCIREVTRIFFTALLLHACRPARRHRNNWR